MGRVKAVDQDSIRPQLKTGDRGEFRLYFHFFSDTLHERVDFLLVGFGPIERVFTTRCVYLLRHGIDSRKIALDAQDWLSDSFRVVLRDGNVGARCVFVCDDGHIP